MKRAWMKTVAAALMGIIFVLIACQAVFAQPGNDKSDKYKGPGYVPGQIIVKFKAEAGEEIDQGLFKGKEIDKITDRDSLKQLNARHKVKSFKPVFDHPRKADGKLMSTQEKAKEVRNKFPIRATRGPKDADVPDLRYVYKMELDSEADITSVCAEYAGDPDVEYAQPNYIYSIIGFPDDPPNDTYFDPYQWALEGRLNCLNAWKLSQGDGIVVAVIDTGVDYDHPDLASNVLCETGYDFGYDDDDPMDIYGHGSHVAGIIAAVGNNNSGIIGVAPGAKIMMLQAFNWNLGDGWGPGADSDALANSLFFAANEGADVINNSWGWDGPFPHPRDQTLKEGVDFAYSPPNNCVIVFSAGNSHMDTANFYPQNDPRVITVSSVDPDDCFSFFSNYGYEVSVCAPGEDILSTVSNSLPYAIQYPYEKLADGYYFMSGTSMAAPHVSGIAALVLERCPWASPLEIKDAIESTAEDNPYDMPGWDPFYGYGRVNAYEAVRCIFHSIMCSVSPSKSAGRVPLDVTFTLSAEERDPSKNLQSWTFDFDDGSTGGAGAPPMTLTHTYDDLGTYNVEFRVVNDQSEEETETLKIYVNNYEEHTVPSIYPTIQEAITAAADGDRIVVAPGTYTGVNNKNLSWSGKHITIKSASPTENFVIDCQNNGRAFSLISQGSGDVIEGVTVTYANDLNGGGIYCNNSSPTIRKCEFRNGHVTLSGGGIYLLNSSASVENCTVANNHADDTGGGIALIGGSPVISDCTVTENNAGKGAGISCYGLDASARVENCTLENNSAGNGGGIYIEGGLSSFSINDCMLANNDAYEGGGIFCKNASPIINKCTIIKSNSGEDAGSCNGGGIYCRDSSSPTITNCVIAENETWYESEGGGGLGGGICCINQSNPVVINSSITANDGDYSGKGGGIYCEGSAPVIKNSIFWDDGDSISSGKEIYAGTYVYVGADLDLHYIGSDVTVIHCDVGTGTYADENSSIVPEGDNISTDPLFANAAAGDYRLDTGSQCEDAGIVVWTDTPDAPTDDRNGRGRVDPPDIGAYEYTAEKETIHVPDDYVSIQRAIDAANDGDTVLVSDGIYGGAGNKNLTWKHNTKQITIESENGPANCIIDCGGDGQAFNFENGETPDTIVEGFTIRNGNGGLSGNGGGIRCYGASPTIRNCVITDCEANCGGAVYLRYGVVNHIENCTISGNTANSGGGIYCSDNPSLILSGCTISDNTANSAGDGGGVYVGTNSGLAAQNCIFSDNLANNSGGAISCNPSSWISAITGCEFSRNTAYTPGGAIYCCSNSPLTVTDSTFTQNKSLSYDAYGAGGGGGLYCGSDLSVISRCQFQENEALLSGGGIRLFRAPNTVIEDCTFTGNQTSWGSGGGVASIYSNGVVIACCTLSDNQSGNFGGGIYCGSDYGDSATIAHCIVTGNRADYYSGGGGGIACFNCPGTIEDCTVLNNIAGDGADGGGIYVRYNGDCLGPTTTISNCIVVGNAADTRGGGIYSFNSASLAFLTISDCVVTGNKTVIENTYGCDGGGICGLQSLKLIENSTISGNESQACGGGIFSIGRTGASPEIKNCVISENFSIASGSYDGGGGIYWDNADSLDITNCTFRNNQTNGSGGGILYVDVDNAVIKNSILWDDAAGIHGPEISLNYSMNLNVSYSDVEGGQGAVYNDGGTLTWGTGNINIDPSFAAGYTGTWTNNSSIYDYQTWFGDTGASFPMPSALAGRLLNPDVSQKLEYPIVYNTGQWIRVSGMASANTGASYRITDCRLDAGSPCINAGTAAGAPAADRDGKERVFGPDLGAYESADLGTTRRVPQNYTTIQAAINAASSGDTVLVANGTYTGTGNTNLSWSGKHIILKSENGPTNCIIDCGAVSGRRGFNLNGTGQNYTDVIDGFTIKDGRAGTGGGGLYCSSVSPTIKNCIIIGCNGSTGSGGIWMQTASPLITGCTITGSNGYQGAAVYCGPGSSPTIENCTISGNTAASGSVCPGIYCYQASPTIRNCTLSANGGGNASGAVAGDGNSGVTIENCTITGSTGSVGGINFLSSGSVSISNCTVDGNAGGGIWCRSNTAVTVNECKITGNSSDNGGGIYCRDNPASVRNCLIAKNTVTANGGGIYSENASPTFLNCTIADNSAGSGSGGIYGCNGGAITVKNSVLWNSGTEITLSGATATVTYSNVEGGYTGTGNLNPPVNPGFVNASAGDYRLTGNSPCINKGTEVGMPSTDLDGNLRDVWEYETDYYPDMGAYEAMFSLNIRIVGSGSVYKDPDQTRYGQGEEVTLTAVPVGSTFDHWEGGATGSANPITVTIPVSTGITAYFTSGEYTLSYNVVPEGTGMISNEPDTNVHYGDRVELYCECESEVAHFDHWSGDASGTQNPLYLFITGDTSVTANCQWQEYTLTTNVSPAQAGTVSRNPDKQTYRYFDQVTLTASANTGYKFNNWSGDASGSQNPKTVTIYGDTSVTANFSGALVWSSFLGQSGYDVGWDVSVDCQGCSYVTGETRSSSFPTTSGAFDESYNDLGGEGRDAFVTKFNSSGSGLVYSTFIGGSYTDVGMGISVASSGHAYVVGYTHSADFPVTSGAYDITQNGSMDAFVLKLASDGGSLEYATYLGSSGYDTGYAIDADDDGSVYVVGNTDCSNYPVTSGVYDTSHNGSFDVFMSKLNSNGSGLGYSTFLGGSGYDWVYEVAVDTSGQAYVVGQTNSGNFPTTTGAFDTGHNGDGDAFISKLDATASNLVYSTFIGDAGYDAACAVAVDSVGCTYVGGVTTSSDFPTTTGAFDTSHNGDRDMFVVKLATDGSGLEYSSFVGGNSIDNCWDIALVNSGRICAVGDTYSEEFPVTAGAYDGTFAGGHDVFLTLLTTNGSGLDYSTFIGGSGDDTAYAVAIDSASVAYVTGDTKSGNFPVTSGAFSTNYHGEADVFVTKLCLPMQQQFYDLSVEIIGSGSVNRNPDQSTYGGGQEVALTATPSTDYYFTGWSGDVSGSQNPKTITINGSAVVTANFMRPLVWSTFLGGSGSDWGYAVAVDSAGCAYVTGKTSGSGFPVGSGYDESQNGSYDAFITKFNAAGTDIVYSTFLGGIYGENYLSGGIAVNDAGEAYVTGATSSPNFPTTSGTYDTSHNGMEDIFVSKLNAAGDDLEFSTFIGGSYIDIGYGLTLDSSGNVYVVGCSGSFNFPVTTGSCQGVYGGGVVCKFNADCSSRIYAVCLGGDYEDSAYDIAVDSAGCAYVTGWTECSDYPSTSGAFNESKNGGEDAFVTKLDAAGNSLAYSTFLGGSGNERGDGIVLDSSGCAYVCGRVGSTGLATSGAYEETKGGGDDAFVAKFSADGADLEYFTYLGGNGADWGSGIALDSSGNVVVTGNTGSSDFPVTDGAYDCTLDGDSDVFVARFNAGASTLEYSTYLGGSSTDTNDWGKTVAVDSFGCAYVTGRTSSGDFPTTSGAYDETQNGGVDVFVTKLSMVARPATCSVDVSSSPGNGGSVSKSPDRQLYAEGAQVTLTASPASGYSFSYWGGDASGSQNPTTITVTGNMNVTAYFVQPGYTLTTSVNPSYGGSVSKNPDKASYASNEVVTLTANPGYNYAFSYWSGSLGGSQNPKNITMTGNASVTANFYWLGGCW